MKLTNKNHFRDTSLIKTIRNLFDIDPFHEDLFEIKHHSGTEISEDDKNFYIEVDLPGADKDKIDIRTENNMLSISYERETREEKKGRRYLTRTTSYGKFKNAFILPDNANVENIKAKYENGILKLRIPKEEHEKVEHKKVPIE